jgi:hypothetical protein
VSLTVSVSLTFAVVYIAVGMLAAEYAGAHDRPHSDLAAMAILMLWPVWLLARYAHRHGWRRR